MHPEERIEVFRTAVILAVLGVAFLGLPNWTVEVTVNLGVSFVISGIFWLLLVELGLDFLEDIKIAGGFVSGMTLVVFLIKNILVPLP